MSPPLSLLTILYLAVVLARADAQSDVRQGQVENGDTPERVEFESGRNKLVGALLLPKGKDPSAAIVFVHGTGPATRDGNGYYPPIWDRFVKAGYACLSWDKPGLGESTGDWKTQTLADRAGEVRAALAYLKTRKEIDSRRIGLWGISQAGYIVPDFAAGGDVAFAILVSPGFVSIAESIRYTLADDFFLQSVLGIPKGDVKKASAFVAGMFQMAQRAAPYEDFIAFLKAGEAKAWFRPLAGVGFPTSGKMTPPLYEKFMGDVSLDPRPTLERITCPLLVIFGSDDKQVDPVRGAKIYQQAASKAGNGDFTLATIPGADHNLIIGQGAGRHISPESLDLLQRWASEHAHETKPH